MTKPRNVLIVEDEPTLCEVYGDFLRERGDHPVVARTAEDALSCLEQTRPDAVLLDIHLPGMSGLDLLRLRITHELGVPVIVISGVPTEGLAHECLEAGATAFMGKPVSLADLAHTLDGLTAAGTPELQADRRAAPRATLAVPVRVRTEDGAEWAGTSVDLSVSGVRVRVPSDARVADSARVRLTVAEPVYLDLPSVSVRVSREEQAYRFTGLSPDERGQLAALVGREPAAGTRVAPHVGMLHRIATAASTSTDAEAVVAVALDALADVTGHEIASLHLLTADGRQLELRGDRGFSPGLREVNRVLPVGDGLIGRVAATGRTLDIADAAAHPDLLDHARDVVRGEGIRAFVCVPVVGHGRVLGTLSLGRRTQNRFTAPEIAVVEAAATQIGLAIENARLLAEARERIADVRRAETLLAESARLSAIGKLAAGLAHEVSNPLSAILAQVEMVLMRGDQPADARERLRVVTDETIRAARLLHTLLEIARPSAGERRACDLAAEARVVLQLTAPQLARDGIGVVTEFAAAPPVHADPGELRQVILNLVQNAHHAMAARAGARVLTVRTVRADDTARLEVADTGPGVPPAVLARVFDAFFTTKPPGQGTGLGLWVSAAIAERHGGRLQAANRPEGGAVFVLELPLAR